MQLCAKCRRKMERELREAFRELGDDLLAQGPTADPEAAIARTLERFDVGRGVHRQLAEIIERVRREELGRYLDRARTTGSGIA